MQAAPISAAVAVELRRNSARNPRTTPARASDSASQRMYQPLYNRAMPLLRYEVGDTGEVSDRRCSCGRGLPLLKDILHSMRGDGRRIATYSWGEDDAPTVLCVHGFASSCRDNWSGWVAISSFSAQMKEAYELADRYRAAGTKVILGGLHVTRDNGSTWATVNTAQYWSVGAAGRTAWGHLSPEE